jgi:hypothetical protein
LILFQVFAAVLATAAALPLEDTADVAAAKATFTAAFEDAAAGGLAAKQAAQIASTYIADDAAVAEAKAAFLAAFEDAEAGGLAAKQAPAPVHEIPVAAPLVAAAPAPLAYPYGISALNALPLGYNGLNYAAAVNPAVYGYAGLPAAYGYGLNAAYGYGLPYAGLPVVAAAKAE